MSFSDKYCKDIDKTYECFNKTKTVVSTCFGVDVSVKMPLVKEVIRKFCTVDLEILNWVLSSDSRDCLNYPRTNECYSDFTRFIGEERTIEQKYKNFLEYPSDDDCSAMNQANDCMKRSIKSCNDSDRKKAQKLFKELTSVTQCKVDTSASSVKKLSTILGVLTLFFVLVKL